MALLLPPYNPSHPFLQHGSPFIPHYILLSFSKGLYAISHLPSPKHGSWQRRLGPRDISPFRILHSRKHWIGHTISASLIPTLHLHDFLGCRHSGCWVSFYALCGLPRILDYPNFCSCQNSWISGHRWGLNSWTSSGCCLPPTGTFLGDDFRLPTPPFKKEARLWPYPHGLKYSTSLADMSRKKGHHHDLPTFTMRSACYSVLLGHTGP